MSGHATKHLRPNREHKQAEVRQRHPPRKRRGDTLRGRPAATFEPSSARLAAVTPESTAEETPQRRPFEFSDTDKLLHFCESHPTTTDGSGLLLLRSLLAELPSGPEYVLDIHLRGERALVAVVLDTLVNASDTGLIIVFGFRQGPHAEDVLGFALDAAERILRAGSTSLLEVRLPGPLEHHAPVLQARGYQIAFREYCMVRPHAGPLAPPPRWRASGALLMPIWLTCRSITPSSRAPLPGSPGTISVAWYTSATCSSAPRDARGSCLTGIASSALSRPPLTTTARLATSNPSAATQRSTDGALALICSPKPCGFLLARISHHG